jgi:lipoprotein-anchoring transpeptidase ErfK/SrfK
MLKSLYVAAVAGAALFAASPAAAADAVVTVEAAAALSPNQFLWADSLSPAPVTILVSIADQRAYVYRGEELVGATSVSTGKDEKATPTGTYTILQKKEAHRSNLYDSAPMPYMQRLTWDGIAIHAGRNPGFPASHGCIRVPAAFAKKLFAATSLGTTVTVVDESVDPSLPPPPSFESIDMGEVADANAAQLTRIADRR